MKNKTPIDSIRFSTKIGDMIACATNKGLCFLDFADKKTLDLMLQRLCQSLNGVITQNNNQYLRKTQQQANDYLSAKRTNFTVDLLMTGSDFQKSVWQALLKIPYGQTMTYTQQAKMIGRDSAVRAVANANGANKISLIIPCHRVIGSDGSLTGYAGGLSRKRFLLTLEGNKSN